MKTAVGNKVKDKERYWQQTKKTIQLNAWFEVSMIVNIQVKIF